MYTMSIKEYAKHANLSVYKVRIMIARKEIPCKKIKGICRIDWELADILSGIIDEPIIKVAVKSDWKRFISKEE